MNTTEIAIAQYAEKSGWRGFSIGMKMALLRIGHDKFHHQDCQQRQHAGHGEYTGDADEIVKRRSSTRDSAKVRPMVPPTMAMALVRCSSRVRSASSAVKTELMAPAP